MKIKFIAAVITSFLATVGLIPSGLAQSDLGSTQEGIEVITVVGKRAMPEGVEVVTVVGKRPSPTVARTCVDEALESRPADRDSLRQAIKDCIERARDSATG